MMNGKPLIKIPKSPASLNPTARGYAKSVTIS